MTSATVLRDSHVGSKGGDPGQREPEGTGFLLNARTEAGKWTEQGALSGLVGHHRY